MYCHIGIRLRSLPLASSVKRLLHSPLVETETRVCHHVRKKDAYSCVCVCVCVCVLVCLIGWAGVDVVKY